MSLQNPSYSEMELTKRILEIETLTDFDKYATHRKIYYYRGSDYIDKEEKYVNTYIVLKKESKIILWDLARSNHEIKSPKIVPMEDFAQFANNNKLQLFNYKRREESKTFMPIHYTKEGIMV